MNWKLPDVQAGFRKCRGLRDQIANIHWIIEKAREFQETSTSASLTALAIDCVVHNIRGKFLNRWEYKAILSTSWETCMQVQKQQLEWDMEQQTDSKLGKEYIKAVYCQSAYSTYTQSTSCEMPGGMNHKLDSRLVREISIRMGTQMTPP